MRVMTTRPAQAPEAPQDEALPQWRGPSPRALALAGFAALFGAGLLLWAKYGVTVFVDGAASLWACL